MSDPDYPLYPTLSEEGKLEAEQIIEKAKLALKKVCDEALGEIYVGIPSWIETDSWTNFRNEVISGFQNYGNRLKQGEYDFQLIRQKIFNEFREDLIKDLNQDNLEKIKRLEDDNKNLRETLDRRDRSRYY